MSTLLCSGHFDVLEAVKPEAEAIEEDEVGSPGAVVDDGDAAVEATQVRPRPVEQSGGAPEAYAVGQVEAEKEGQEDGAGSSPGGPVVLDVRGYAVQPGQHDGRDLVDGEHVMCQRDPDEEHGEGEECLSLPPDTLAVDERVFERVSRSDQIIHAATQSPRI